MFQIEADETHHALLVIYDENTTITKASISHVLLPNEPNDFLLFLRRQHFDKVNPLHRP